MVFRFFALLFVLLFLPTGGHAAPAPRASAARWERIHVTRVRPSQVFAHLGLTRITRLGYTRDGAKKGASDPTFPAGLTDVVPYDADHILLVRGTAAGRAAFRAQVALAEKQIAAVRWHLQAQLVTDTNGASVSVGLPVTFDVPDDTPTPLTLSSGEGQQERPYQIRIVPGAAGAVTVLWQRGITLNNTARATNVLAPPVAWSAAVARTPDSTNSVTFDDLASERVTARQALGLPPEPTAQDYGVRITVTLLVPNPAPTVLVAPLPTAPAAPAPTVP